MSRVAVPLVVSAVVGLIVAGAAWAIGVTLVQSAVVGVCVVAVGAGRGIIEAQQAASAGDHWRGNWTLTQGGSRRDVRQLGWRMRADRGRVHGAALQRLRRVARSRLGRHGIDLDDPAQAAAAEARLGTTAHRVLTAEHGRAVRYAAFVQAVDALERLGEPDRSGGPVAATSHPIPEPR
ncbi:MAG TPA: hypothetical protein VK906_07930 [Egicoccus sp.]|nr:hypothetical protein [Egicoccus sp.]HSK23087.1 hypothetical protein [Egicoccus sp.]